MKRPISLIIATFAIPAAMLINAPTSIAAQAQAATASAAAPTCGTQPVKLNAMFETGFDLPFKLSDEFTKEYPNVTFNISQDQFANLINETPRLLAGDNPPDLIRLPTLVSFAKDGLLKNLDDYATAFGWDKWPVPQLNQARVVDREVDYLPFAIELFKVVVHRDRLSGSAGDH